MILACILACAQQFDFPMQQVPMGDSPTDLAVADMDGDGRPDLLTSNNSGHAVTLRRGDGWGGFGRLESFPLPNAAHAILVDDLDGNGWPDVVASMSTAFRVSVLRGDGAGGLLPEESYGVGDHPAGLASGDVNGDGVPDLVVANSWDDSVSVLLGVGAAKFQPGPLVPTGVFPGVALADLDVDGILDLVVPGSEDLFVHAGLGQGQFGPPVAYAVLGNYDLALGDLDENGFTDAVACPAYGPKISILLDDGAGGFDPATNMYVQSLQEMHGALIVDLDEDGHVDLVGSAPPQSGSSSWGSQVWLFRGDGTGILPAPEVTQVAGAGKRFVAADVVVDGHLDLLVIPAGAGGVLLLPGDGKGGLPVMQNGPAGSGPKRFGLGDANGDGLPDAIIPWGQSPYGYLRVSLGDGAGQFPIHWQDVSSEAIPSVGGLADLDEDGDQDAVAACSYAHQLEIFTGDGTGKFSNDPVLTFPTGGESTGLALVDLQGDGHLDLVSADQVTDKLTIVLGHGSMSFGTPSQVSVGVDPADLAAVDLDGDGLPELVTADSGSKTLTVVSFGVGSQTIPVPAGARGLATGDLDEDGNLDAAVTGVGDALTLLLGDGADGLQLLAEVHTGTIGFDPLLADLDDDGHVDLVLLDQERRALALLPGKGGGGFGPVQFLGVGELPKFVEAGDFNLDGRVDLATIWGGALAVHLQQPEGPFALVPGGAAGVHGVPLLKLAGSLEPDSELVLLLQGAAPGQPVTLVAGMSAILAPFKGGVLVPAPGLILQLSPTDSLGQLALRTEWPAGVSSAVSYFAQAWLPDAAASQGWAGSTGVGVLTP